MYCFNKLKSIILSKGNKITRDIVIPKGKTEIKKHKYKNRNDIRSIVIPEGVTRIGEGAFSLCDNLESVSLPSTLERIDVRAFGGCGKLTEIEIPESVREIHGLAFCNCKSITSIKLPKQLKYLGKRVFSGCVNLVDVQLPDCISVVDSSVFRNCNKLNEAILKKSEKTVENAEAMKEYAYLLPYYNRYKENHPNETFEHYVQWAKAFTPVDFPTPSADPFCSHGEDPNKFSGEMRLAKNGEGYIALWR